MKREGLEHIITNVRNWDGNYVEYEAWGNQGVDKEKMMDSSAAWLYTERALLERLITEDCGF